MKFNYIVKIHFYINIININNRYLYFFKRNDTKQLINNKYNTLLNNNIKDIKKNIDTFECK